MGKRGSSDLPAKSAVTGEVLGDAAADVARGRQIVAELLARGRPGLCNLLDLPRAGWVSRLPL